MNIFKAYDIRGVYGEEINTELAYKLGKVYRSCMGYSDVVVGYDARLHSRELCEALIGGLTDSECEVANIGLSTTPQLHFFQIKAGYSSGIIVTASHNPPEYHGFKFFDSEGGSISYDKGLNRMEKSISELQVVNIKSVTKPEIDGLSKYIDFLYETSLDAELKGLSFKVVIDVSNGSAGAVFSSLVHRLSLNAVLINSEPDGRFPHHNPNPLEDDSRKQISKAILRQNANLGILLDGDGDRIIFFDEKGEAVESYFIATLIAEELLSLYPESSIVYDLISSRVLPERVSELGGKPIISRVGYTFLYDQMVKHSALFGAEASGHAYFKVSDKYYTESAAYALIVVLRLLARREESLSELVLPLKRKYYQVPEINFTVEDKEKILEQIEKKYSGGKIEKLDGLSVSFDDFWFNVRPSNTEPVLRFRLEAKNRGIAEARAGEIALFIRKA